MADEDVQDINAIEGNGNGVLSDEEIDRLFAGGKGSLKDLQEEQGILAKMASQQNRGTSVMMRFITAVDDDHYRDILLTGISDKQLARITAMAIDESREFGVPITPIVDRLHGEASTEIGAHKQAILSGLNNSTYTINRNGIKGTVGRWFNRNKEDDNSITGS